ncbi:hypothetical protein Slin14017_G034150 [Septoria linicola]|nr:hypothetical protein Slin14017_G034150 [Septoria linicola]
MSLASTTLVALALLFQQAVAQTDVGCSWVTPTLPSLASTTPLVGFPDPSPPILDPIFITVDPTFITVTAEIPMTAFKVCNGTTVASATDTTSQDSSSTTITSSIVSKAAPSTSLPETLDSLHSTTSSVIYQGTVTAVTTPSVKHSSTGSSSIPLSTFETLTSRPISDAPNLPSSLPVESSQTSTTSKVIQGPSTSVSKQHSSTSVKPSGSSESTRTMRPSSGLSHTNSLSQSTWIKTSTISSTDHSSSTETQSAWTKTSTVLSTGDITSTLPGSTVQTTKPVFTAHTTRETSTTSTLCSAEKSQTTTPPATQSANIVSQLPDGQIQAGNPHGDGQPTGIITSVAWTDVAEHPPFWNPGPITSSTLESTSMCSNGTRSFECANPTAIPSKFRTERLSKVGPSSSPCSTGSVVPMKTSTGLNAPRMPSVVKARSLGQ